MFADFQILVNQSPVIGHLDYFQFSSYKQHFIEHLWASVFLSSSGSFCRPLNQWAQTILSSVCMMINRLPEKLGQFAFRQVEFVLRLSLEITRAETLDISDPIPSSICSTQYKLHKLAGMKEDPVSALTEAMGWRGGYRCPKFHQDGLHRSYYLVDMGTHCRLEW